MITNSKDRDKGKVPVKVSRNLIVLIKPEDATPVKIKKLKEKYAKCTGSVGSNFW